TAGPARRDQAEVVCPVVVLEAPVDEGRAGQHLAGPGRRRWSLLHRRDPLCRRLLALEARLQIAETMLDRVEHGVQRGTGETLHGRGMTNQQAPAEADQPTAVELIVVVVVPHVDRPLRGSLTL